MSLGSGGGGSGKAGRSGGARFAAQHLIPPAAPRVPSDPLEHYLLSVFRHAGARQRATALTQILYASEAEELQFCIEKAHELLRKRNFISEFPDELSMKIFSYFSYRDLCCVAAVSRDWRRLSGDPVLWKRLCMLYFQRSHLSNPSERLTRELSESDWKRNFTVLQRFKQPPTELAGELYSAAISPTATLYAWGGASSLPLECDSPHPMPVKSLRGVNVVGVSIKWQHFVALSDYGAVFAWGFGKGGRLGLGDPLDEPAPQRVRGFLDPSRLSQQGDSDGCNSVEELEVVGVSAGVQHSAAVTSSGDLFTWGDGYSLQLGLGEADRTDKHRPTFVPFFREKGIRCDSVSCGLCHTLVVSRDGDVFAFGRSPNGQCGLGVREFVPIPLKVYPARAGGEGSASPAFVAASAGISHSAAVTVSGELYTWGRNSGGSLGRTTAAQCPHAKVVDALAGVRVVTVSCGGAHTACVSDEGDVYTWGENATGQLGHGDNVRMSRPKRVAALPHKCQAVSAGNGHTMAVTECRKVYVWGLAWNNRLGIVKDRHHFDSPVSVALQ